MKRIDREFRAWLREDKEPEPQTDPKKPGFIAQLADYVQRRKGGRNG